MRDSNHQCRVKLKYKLSYAVVTPENVVIEAGFTSKTQARDFIQKNPYYTGCSVDLVRTNLEPETTPVQEVNHQWSELFGETAKTERVL